MDVTTIFVPKCFLSRMTAMTSPSFSVIRDVIALTIQQLNKRRMPASREAAGVGAPYFNSSLQFPVFGILPK